MSEQEIRTLRQERVREEARLILLRALTEDPAGRSNSSMLQASLEEFGLTKSRDWLHAEIRALQERGAVTVREADTVLVVEITQRGTDHVERRAYLDGVKRPSARTV